MGIIVIISYSTFFKKNMPCSTWCVLLVVQPERHTHTHKYKHKHMKTPEVPETTILREKLEDEKWKKQHIETKKEESSDYQASKPNLNLIA